MSEDEAPAGAAPRDEVDSLVQAWARERPDLDPSPMQVLSRVTRLAHYLDRHRRRAFARHDLEPWEFDVLAALRRSGEPYQLSPGQLLRETMVTSGTMTNRVDRLVARGLVTRTDHPDDRRGVLVRLTRIGREAVDAAISDLLTAEQEILSVLPSAQRDQLAEALRQLTAPYEISG
ncbi:MarR family winged helix-turn-helix transcriptional regulator [Microlunatus sp. Gsoil 973]|jgi:DNA-binding MarR family transcriptional regulator|uniref:MarR family winged helix-turn-helix transcriptional regulator n=1 Tax=Microlunatus sp. Gsoil 973 TaxID=2672569 RepID=UPI0012B47AF3|nr:MarR family transcriptional regulator [Microlunatus sp. Gsoil 973]QGN33558.1 MarR family transcriptional regulator [Microlunatus sp. Gsoil 973]